MAHTRLNPLMRWARTRQGAVEQPDFGDHGTAFGMELSMAPAATVRQSVPVSPAAARTEAATAAPGEVVGMWRRLSGRRPWRAG